MRCFLFLLASIVLAQDSPSRSATYTYDVNGRRVLNSVATASSGAGGSTSSEGVGDLNGRSAPLRSVEERVVSDGPEGRVVERMVRRYDGAGNSAGFEKVRLEERKNSDGSVSTTTTTYDSDLNGRFALREKTTALATKSGDTVRTEMATERPDINGRMEPTERRNVVVVGDDKNSRQDISVFRKDSNGRFQEAAREVTEVKTENGDTVAHATQYNTAATGRMEIAGQRVSRTSRQADGSETQVVNLYGPVAPGQVDSGGPAPRLREQQIIERKAGDSGYTQTFSIRRPAVDSSQLGPVQKISETVCQGPCKP